MKNKPTSDQIDRLAHYFSSILLKWLGKKKLATINRKNKTKAYQNGACATHDYCDPNQAMIDAWTVEIGREIKHQSNVDTFLINTAWDLARYNDFYIN